MSKSSRLGYSAEHAVEVYLTARGYPCTRPRAGAVLDKGDLAGPPVVISVKNHAALKLAEWVDALPGMCKAAGLAYGVVWHKRRGKGSPGDWYVTMTGATFADLMTAYRPPERSTWFVCDTCMSNVREHQIAFWTDHHERVMCVECWDREAGDE